MRTRAAIRGILIVLLSLGLSAAACGDTSSGSGSGGASGAAGQGGGGGQGGALGSSERLECYDLFSGGAPIACCPVGGPNCRTIPDGYYAPEKQGRCVEGAPGTRNYCSCNCTRGEWLCGC